MTQDPKKTLAQIADDALKAEFEYMDELLPQLYQTHFGKYLVVSAQARKYWIVDTQPEAERKAMSLASQNDPAIGTASYIPIKGPTTKGTKPH